MKTPQLKEVMPTEPRVVQSSPESVVWGDLASALYNLGATKKRAHQIALALQSESPDAEFDELIRRGVQMAREAA